MAKAKKMIAEKKDGRGGKRINAGSKPQYDGGVKNYQTTIPKKAFKAMDEFVKEQRDVYRIKK